MVLAIRELERGDGEWENIQPVLRSAFLSIQRTSNKHIERMKSCEQSTQSQSRQQLKQQQHLEAVARAVNELSEALKAHIEDEEIHRQEQKSTIQSILKDVSRQLQESETRLVTQMDTLANSLAPLERRVVLVEEELHHIESALEGKASMEHVQKHLGIHQKSIENALKQRCRKVAFDREVQRVHQLLHGQHALIDDRCELIRNDLSHEIQDLLNKSKERTSLPTDHQWKQDVETRLCNLIVQRTEELEAVKNELRLEFSEAVKLMETGHQTMQQVIGEEHLENALKEHSKRQSAALDAEIKRLETQIEHIQDATSRAIAQQTAINGLAVSKDALAVVQLQQHTLHEQFEKVWGDIDANKEATASIQSQQQIVKAQLEMIRHHIVGIDVNKEEIASVQLQQQTLKDQLETIRDNILGIDVNKEKIASVQLLQQSLNGQLETIRDEVLGIDINKEEIAAVQLQQQTLNDQLETIRDDILSIDVNQEELTTVQQTLKEQLEKLRGDVTVIDSNKERLDVVQLQQQMFNEQIEKLRGTIDNFTSAVNAIRLEVSERLQRHQQQLISTRDTTHEAFETMMKSKDKKTRQQLHAIVDKLLEMDSVVQMVGKQLVQNTSQLQILWTDHQETADNTVDTGKDRRGTEEASEEITGVVDTTPFSTKEEEYRRRRAQHEELEQIIGEKLQDYQHILERNEP